MLEALVAAGGCDTCRIEGPDGIAVEWGEAREAPEACPSCGHPLETVVVVDWSTHPPHGLEGV